MKIKLTIIIVFFNLLSINTELKAVTFRKASRVPGEIKPKAKKQVKKVSQYKRVKCEFGCSGTFFKPANRVKHYARKHYKETCNNPKVAQARKTIDRENSRRKLRNDYKTIANGPRVPVTNKKHKGKVLVIRHGEATFTTKL